MSPSRTITYTGFLILSNLLGPQTLAKSYDGFASMRLALMEEISAAKHRVWLTTQYLTDGDLVMSLYVARYRKIDVQVVLHRAKSRAYMSRYTDLKRQNIPVDLKSLKAKPYPTTLIIDDRVLHVNGDLNFMAKGRGYQVTEGDDMPKYAALFKASDNTVETRSKPPAKWIRSKPSTLPGRGGPVISGSSSSGAYTYSKSDGAKPSEVPARLPNQTIWQKRQSSGSSQK